MINFQFVQMQRKDNVKCGFFIDYLSDFMNNMTKGVILMMKTTPFVQNRSFFQVKHCFDRMESGERHLDEQRVPVRHRAVP